MCVHVGVCVRGTSLISSEPSRLAGGLYPAVLGEFGVVVDHFMDKCLKALKAPPRPDSENSSFVLAGNVNKNLSCVINIYEMTCGNRCHF